MPELTAVHFGLLALTLIVGVMLGWIFRSDRCAKEKIAVNAIWQEQLQSQQSEHNRLAEQNKSLMEQISQYQASHKDHSNRAKELSDSLKEALARRDELQRQLKDMRGSLDVAIAQRDRLQSKNLAGQQSALREKDDKIFKLSRELTSWQSRVPPLVERFQERDRQASKLEQDLEKATTRIAALEELVKSDQTRIEPVDAESLPDGGDASNEPIAMTSIDDASALQDQVEEEPGQETSHHDFTSVHEFAAPEEAPVEEILSEEFATVFSDDAEAPAEGDGSGADEDEAPGVETVAAAGARDESMAERENDTGPATDGADDQPVSDEATGMVDQNDGDDDLQLIKGIGPSIERMLHDLGIHRFHQIAEMSEYDIDRVAQQLRGFRSRIYREDWIGQARDLLYQKDKDRY